MAQVEELMVPEWSFYIFNNIRHGIHLTVDRMNENIDRYIDSYNEFVRGTYTEKLLEVKYKFDHGIEVTEEDISGILEKLDSIVLHDKFHEVYDTGNGFQTSESLEAEDGNIFSINHDSISIDVYAGKTLVFINFAEPNNDGGYNQEFIELIDRDRFQSYAYLYLDFSFRNTNIGYGCDLTDRFTDFHHPVRDIFSMTLLNAIYYIFNPKMRVGHTCEEPVRTGDFLNQIIACVEEAWTLR